MEKEFIKTMVKHMNCFQTAFLPICVKYDIDPLKMFLWGWSFNYDNNPALYNRISVSYCMDTKQFLEEQLGLEIKEIRSSTPINITEMFDIMSAGNEMVIGLDAFYCPWSSAYQKMHISHFINVIEVDVSKNVLCCNDWYTEEEPVYELPYEDLIAGRHSINCVHVKEKTARGSVHELLVACYKQKSDIKQDFAKFANDIKAINDIGELFESSDARNCNIIIKIKECKGYRNGIALYMKNALEDKEGGQELEEASMMFESLGKMWDKLLKSLLKLLIVNRAEARILDKIANNIIEIGELEEKTYQFCISNPELFMSL